MLSTSNSVTKMFARKIKLISNAVHADKEQQGEQ